MTDVEVCDEGEPLEKGNESPKFGSSFSATSLEQRSYRYVPMYFSIGQ